MHLTDYKTKLSKKGLSPRYTLSLSGLRMRSCSVLLRNERVQSQQELVHGVMLGAELLDLGGSKDVWGEHHAQFQTLRLAHVAKVVLCLLYTSPSPRDGLLSRMPSSA